VRRLLGAHVEVEEEVTTVSAGGERKREKVKRQAHETDGWDHGRWNRKVRRPGSVPKFVLESEIPKGAKTERHESDVEEPDEAAMDHACYHHARHLVVLARQRHAKAVAVLPPRENRDAKGRLVLESIFVL